MVQQINNFKKGYAPSIFILKEKKDKSHRLILCLKKRNLDVVYRHFKMYNLNTVLNGSRTIAPGENLLPTQKLTLTSTLTLTKGRLSSGAIVWLPQTLKLTLTLTETPPLTGGGQFSLGDNRPDTVLNMVRRDCYMASTDLADVYYTV